MPAGFLCYSDFKIGVEASALARLIAALFGLEEQKKWVLFFFAGYKKDPCGRL
jgi:hypothetical protein